MSTALLAEVPLMTDDRAAAERALREITDRLTLAYPAVAPDRIDAMLRASYDATRDAKVQNYRLVLAERDTRIRLRHETAAGPAAGTFASRGSS